jgi:hypothetical protein
MPGIAFAIRPNVRLVAVGSIERSNGFPTLSDGTPQAWQGGAADWAPIQIAPSSSDPGKKTITEFQSIGLFLAWAM